VLVWKRKSSRTLFLPSWQTVCTAKFQGGCSKKLLNALTTQSIRKGGSPGAASQYRVSREGTPWGDRTGGHILPRRRSESTNPPHFRFARQELACSERSANCQPFRGQGPGHLFVERNSFPALTSLSISTWAGYDTTHHNARCESVSTFLSYGSCEIGPSPTLPY